MEKVLKEGKDQVQLSVNQKMYPLSAVYAAGYVFLDRAYIYLDKDSKGRILVWLFPKDKKENLTSLGMDFYNELLNYAHYFTSLKVNADSIKTLMQRALFSVAPSLANEAAEKKIEQLIDELEEEEKKEGSKKD